MFRSLGKQASCPLHQESRNIHVFLQTLSCSGNVLPAGILQVLLPNSLLLSSINIIKLLFSSITAILIIILLKSKCMAPQKLIHSSKVKHSSSKRDIVFAALVGSGVWSDPPFLSHGSAAPLFLLFQWLPQAVHIEEAPQLSSCLHRVSSAQCNRVS